MKWFRDLVTATNSDATRSSVMASIQFLSLTWIGGTIGVGYATGGSVPAILTMASVPTGLAVFFCFVYWRLIHTNPDALRSEKFYLRKLQIEKGMVGDDSAGLMDPDSVPQLPPTTSQGDLALPESQEGEL
ncbi:MAG: hypothetical protein ACJ8C4_02485 [Gemmataceae bacterium]